ncbi:MAG: hypothetical protein JKX69_01875 [Rhodobacteraceae bacterium]|nr:hypothetical protein [Paracoccaceae bacterium]
MFNGQDGLIAKTRGQNGALPSAVAGPGASAIKYDILTALLVTTACGDAGTARLSLRLSLLITARFNWRRGVFAVGLRELARMWGVTERTAKREMAQMRTRGWITVDIPPARGRVTQYRLELAQILTMTMPHWQAVGPDFAARMAGGVAPEKSATNVVPLRPDGLALPAPDGTSWPAIAARLQGQDPSTYSAWFAPLVSVEAESGVLTLMAPSGFVATYVRTHYHTRLLAALLAEDPTMRDVQIIGPQG